MKAANRPIRMRSTKSNLVSGFNNAGSVKAAAFLIVVGLLVSSFYLTSSASSSKKVSQGHTPAFGLDVIRPAGERAKVGEVNSVKASIILSLGSSIFTPLFPAPQAPPESIATYAPDCTTAKSDFNLGDVVCAKATGVPVTLFPWHVFWIDPSGNVRQVDTASSNNQTEYRYTVPLTRTSDVNGQTVDNRGTWRVNLTRSTGAVRQTALFTVHEPAQPAADVFVQKFNRDASASVASGGNIAFILVVGNQGPDTALLVHLVDSVPSGSTLVSFTQQSGPACVPADGAPANNCTMASLAKGDRAEFTAIYNTGSTAPGTVSTSASVSSQTPDQDTSNNTSTAEFTVTSGGGATNCVLTCPTIIPTAANTTENGQRGAHVSYPDPEFTGDCGSISSTPASGSFFPVGTTTVNATSETGGGSCSFTVTVEERGGPGITCPPNKTATADSQCQATVDPGTPTTTGDNVTVTSSRSDDRSLNDPYPSGTTTITWTATNSSGSSSCQQTITVNDTTPPTITAGPNQTASADANCQAAVPDFTASATTSDNCGSVEVTQDPAAGTPVGPGSHTVTLTATDGSGNSSTAIVTFTVSDTTPPSVTAPADSSASADANCQAPVPNYVADSTATDNCGTPTVTQSPAAGTLVGAGPHTVTVTATDTAGNTGSDTVVFTVNDTTAPVITCPANITRGNDPGTCSANINPGTPTATDNCGTPTVTGTRSDGQPLVGSYPKGTTTITWTATDGSGNSSSCAQTVTVNDTENPVISCPANITVYLPMNSTATSVVVNYQAPVGSDNCPGATTTQTVGLPSGASFPVGTTTNTFTVTDGANHITSCSFTVKVLYNFTGFFSPVSNPPIVNLVNAGRSIPLKFSLSGYKGLDIFAAGYPASQQIACNSSAPLSDLEGTETPGGSTLTYSPDTYHYNWKTESSWAGTCRQLVVKLNDGSEYIALFKFK